MPHSLSVTVHVDLDLREVVLVIAGCLTSETSAALLPIVTQARSLDPTPSIALDLLGTQHIDADGLDRLRRELDRASRRQASLHRPSPVLDIRAPETLPTCPLTAASPRADGSDSPPLHQLRRAADAEPGDVGGSEGSTAQAGGPLAHPEQARRRTAPRSRREEILAGAAEMFAEHGYHGASLRDIAAHIGMSHPGLMHHFPSKDSLFHAVIDDLEDHAQGVIDAVGRLSAGPEMLLKELGRSWHPRSLPVRLLSTLGAESISGDHPGRFRMARLRRVHEHVLEQCFAAYDAQGKLRQGLDPGFAGRALLGLVLNLAVREKTVRAMQSPTHDDAPLQDLTRMLRSFLSKDAVG